jgi:hypothetical protein
MTPQKKADELYSKYDNLLNKDFGNPIVFDNQIKQCALIAVDEILFSNNTIFETNIPHECWKYWLEVKQEIEKL